MDDFIGVSWRGSRPGSKLAGMDSHPTSRADWIAMAALAIAGLTLGVLMVFLVTERVPHLEDEITYLFQARTFARGALAAPSPPDTHAFFTPFVVIINGNWLGKYPIGWPLILSLGERFGAGWLINPILGGLLGALVYMLGRDLYGRQVGILGGIMAVTSPFFLIQSSTYMSHNAAAVLFVLFVWAWFRLQARIRDGAPTMGYALLAGTALGVMVITRSLSSAGAAAPFIIASLVQVLRRPRQMWPALKAYLPLAGVTLLIAALQPAYLWVTTGSPTTNLYQVVWPYDRLGWGEGISPDGIHTLKISWTNAKRDVKLWASELYGLPSVSWLPLLAGLVLGTISEPRARRWRPALLAAPFVTLVLVHMAYWVGAEVYGPRYYYEAHGTLAVLAGLGLWEAVRLADRLLPRRTPAEGAKAEADALHLPEGTAAYALVVLMVAISGTLYLPDRLNDWHGMYEITREPVRQVQAVADDTPLLVFVEGPHWVQYGPLFYFNSPWLDGPVVAAHLGSEETNQKVIETFTGREVWYYWVDGVLSQEPPPERPDEEDS